MTQPDGITYPQEKVLHRAYSRVGELTMQVDQWVAAYEEQSLEVLRLREQLDDATRFTGRGPAAPGTAT